MPARQRHRPGDPEGALYLATYARLHEYLLAFAQGHLNLLILVGQAGIAKSRTVREMLGGDACWIEGNATPFGMYERLYQNRGRFVVIDDVDSLYADKSGIRLLKCLCQTEEEKAVAWHTNARSLEKHGIPREFTTTSRVIIICNDWKTLNRNVAALQDRGHVLVFQPSTAEVHRQAGVWFHDLKSMPGSAPTCTASASRPSVTTCAPASSRRRAWTGPKSSPPSRTTLGRGWRRRSWRAPLTQAPGTRCRTFVRHGGGCRATFFNYRRRLRA